jgi:hypothetical protein
LKKLRLKLDEARFFFPPDTRAFCENIEKQVYGVLVASRAASGYSEDRLQRIELRDKQSKAEIELPPFTANSQSGLSGTWASSS